MSRPALFQRDTATPYRVDAFERTGIHRRHVGSILLTLIESILAQAEVDGFPTESVAAA
mgnify:CR=1 FL=1